VYLPCTLQHRLIYFMNAFLEPKSTTPTSQPF
jgi:hypothetical protein